MARATSSLPVPLSTLDDHGQGCVGHAVEQMKQVQHARGLPHNLVIVVA